MSRRLFIDLDKCIECSECRVRCAAWYRTKDNESAVLTLRELAAFGVKRAYEAGPGNVLAGLAKRTAPELEVFSLAARKDTERFVAPCA